MTANLHIITTPTADTPGTILILHTVSRSYVFGNHGEGTQRAITHMGQRLTRVQDFFMTGRTEWNNIGGLPGMVLTLADSTTTRYENAKAEFERKQSDTKKKSNTRTNVEPERPRLNIHGPPNIKHMLGTCRRFIFRKSVPVHATEYKDVAPKRSEAGHILPSWQDSNIQVWSLPVAPSNVSEHVQLQHRLDQKRSAYDMHFNDFDEHQAPDSESLEDRELRYDRIRTALVKHMFDSNWSMDTLQERHISEIELPAPALFVRNPDSNKLEPYHGPLPGGDQPLPDVKVLTRTPWPGALITALPPSLPASESLSYIVRTHGARGKFDVERAKKLGVKPGPNFSRLTAGHSVQSMQNETITPEMVMGPDRPGQGFAILDVPTLGHLEALILREELKSDHIMMGIQACIWLLGPGISGHPKLQTFMNTLNHVEHVVSSVDDCPNRLAMDSVAAQTIRLGQIDVHRYHTPFHDNCTLPQVGLQGRISRKEGPLNNAVVAERGMVFRLMPSYALSKEAITPLLSIPEIKATTPQDIIDLGNAARKDVENHKTALEAWKRLIARPDTEITTLGTGSATPSKYRNVSSTLLRVPGVGNYLFDCGENTIGQLRRVFAPGELIDILLNLRMIWISHLHADHHLGTTSVIKAWYNVKHNGVPANTPPSMPSISTCAPIYGLSVISHGAMLKWLKEYSFIEDFGYSRILPLQVDPVIGGRESGSTLMLSPNPNLKGYESEYTLKREDYQTVLGLSDIQACKVSHCNGAMAVSITFPESSADASTNGTSGPLKVSYSGDCRPSHNFTKIGRGSTLLIHEATFDDELWADAMAKKHSTTSEALSIAARMNAKAVVLTHFSQRYQKLPVLQPAAEDEEHLPAATATEEALEGEEIEEEEDAEDPTMSNMDVTPMNAGGAAVPFTKAHWHEPGERVVKVRSPNMKVAVAFDYMRVKLGDVAQLQYFHPALSKLLADEALEEGLAGGEEINGNGKKVSGDDGDGEERKTKKKSKRYN
ncbi:hypothetical protein K504DRAFT_12673 [Pleomassaria siparia CBS 279.74]|uniref:ribonuclease Z n=1 Tax=Pleomassaria siparia CBS 279.74 TaxID=1314801 RepID=A0A6G1KQX1_9PLEO|nr:hypothetical protein K504DRAFT_12673 [Pleomassaria siparia CBS 279.74]